MNQLPVEQIDESMIQKSSLLAIFSIQNESILDEQLRIHKKPEYELLIKKIVLILIGRAAGLLIGKASDIVSDKEFVRSLFEMDPNMDRLKTILKYEMDPRVLKTDNEQLRLNLLPYDKLKEKYIKLNEDYENLEGVSWQEFNNLVSKYNDSEVKIEELKEELNSCLEINVTNQKIITDLTDEVKRLSSFNEELLVEEKTLTDIIEKHTASIEANESTKDSRISELETMTKTLVDINDTKTIEIESLKESNNSLHSEIQRLEMQVASLLSTIESHNVSSSPTTITNTFSIPSPPKFPTGAFPSGVSVPLETVDSPNFFGFPPTLGNASNYPGMGFFEIHPFNETPKNDISKMPPIIISDPDINLARFDHELYKNADGVIKPKEYEILYIDGYSIKDPVGMRFLDLKTRLVSTVTERDANTSYYIYPLDQNYSEFGPIESFGVKDGDYLVSFDITGVDDKDDKDYQEIDAGMSELARSFLPSKPMSEEDYQKIQNSKALVGEDYDILYPKNVHKYPSSNPEGYSFKVESINGLHFIDLDTKKILAGNDNNKLFVYMRFRPSLSNDDPNVLKDLISKTVDELNVGDYLICYKISDTLIDYTKNDEGKQYLENMRENAISVARSLFI